MNGSINDSAAQQQRDEKFMRMAINEARQALKREEVPIGAVVVAGDRIVGRGHNLVETLQDATAHAEMQALTAASSTLGGKYLRDCTLYVTVEPCVMCAGAIVWSQAARVVWGADDPKRGYTTVEGLRLHPRTVVVRGVLAAECEALMKEFSKSCAEGLRRTKKNYNFVFRVLFRFGPIPLHTVSFGPLRQGPDSLRIT